MNPSYTPTVSTPPPPLTRALGTALAGSALFGLATGLGHTPRAMLAFGLAAPALFLGSAALALPPLCLAVSASPRPPSIASVVRATGETLGLLGVALAGLAAPAAFFSVTMHTRHAPALLVVAVIVAGGVALRSLSKRVFVDTPSTLSWSLATGWNVLAVVLGLRTLVRLGDALSGVLR